MLPPRRVLRYSLGVRESIHGGSDMPRTPWRRYADLRAVEQFPGVTRRTLTSGASLTLVEILIDAGAEVPEHAHPHEQAGHVASGRVRFRIGDESREVEAGDSYCIPSGVSHHAVALEDARLIEVFSPVREDFLDG